MSEANEVGFVRDPDDSTHAMSAFILIKQMKDKSGPLAAIQSNASRAKYNMSLAGRCSRMCILFGYVLVPVVPDLSSSHSLLYVSDYVLTCQEFQEPPVVIPRLVTMGMVSTFRFLLLPRAHVTYPSFLRIAGFEYWAHPSNPLEGFITWMVDGQQGQLTCTCCQWF